MSDFRHPPRYCPDGRPSDGISPSWTRRRFIQTVGSSALGRIALGGLSWPALAEKTASGSAGAGLQHAGKTPADQLAVLGRHSNPGPGGRGGPVPAHLPVADRCPLFRGLPHSGRAHARIPLDDRLRRLPAGNRTRAQEGGLILGGSRRLSQSFHSTPKRRMTGASSSERSIRPERRF